MTSLKVEKDYVVTDSYWSEGQFIRYINKAFEKVPKVPCTG